MITEIVLLLGILGFLCVRNDYVMRKVPFVMAMCFWGISRILTEITFKIESVSGELRYDWGSLSACTAAGCLFFCLLCIFWACLGSGNSRIDSKNGEDTLAKEVKLDDTPKNASERIKELIENDGGCQI